MSPSPSGSAIVSAALSLALGVFLYVTSSNRGYTPTTFYDLFVSVRRFPIPLPRVLKGQGYLMYSLR